MGCDPRPRRDRRLKLEPKTARPPRYLKSNICQTNGELKKGTRDTQAHPTNTHNTNTKAPSTAQPHPPEGVESLPHPPPKASNPSRMGEIRATRKSGGRSAGTKEKTHAGKQEKACSQVRGRACVRAKV